MKVLAPPAQAAAAIGQIALCQTWAEVLGANDIFCGVNAVDYSGYPDCRPAFIEAFERLAGTRITTNLVTGEIEATTVVEVELLVLVQDGGRVGVVVPWTDGGTLARLLAGLNPQQREAVLHSGSPLLIVAGAGSGKTAVLISHRFSSVRMADRILVLDAGRDIVNEQLSGVRREDQP